MKIYMITADEAAKKNQSNKIGIYSDGCIGPWGEGATLTEAMEDAKRHYPAMDMVGVWAEEIIKS